MILEHRVQSRELCQQKSIDIQEAEGGKGDDDSEKVFACLSLS